MSIAVTLISYSILLLQITLATGAILYLLNKATGKLSENKHYTLITAKIQEYYLYLIFGLASTATLGSLYFSQILGWTPCLLCWYQRILMYPLALIAGIGLFLRKDDVADYLIPFSMIGAAIAFYHIMIQKVSYLSFDGCSAAQVSCEAEFMNTFGYMTVPVLALTTFTAILVLATKFNKNESII